MHNRTEVRRVLVDTSSAILLFKAGLWPVLIGCYRVVCSRSVFDELTAEGHTGHDVFTDAFIQRRLNVSYEYRSCLLNLPLRGGERDIILLYLSGQGDFVLIDDKKGSRYCRDNAIPYTNALLMARIMGYAGCIDADVSNDSFAHLLIIGRYSREIRDFAVRCPPGDLSAFYP